MKSKSHRYVILARAIVAAGIFAAATTAWGETYKILQIEEQWELQIGEPDTDLSAPQTTMVMSPSDNLDGTFFLVTVNHRSSPGYQPGGVQVQLWDGASAVASADASFGPLDQTGDTIGWTQRLKVDEGVLSFEVVDGSSNSWGSFGNDGNLRVSTPTTLDSLNNYQPSISLTESQNGYAGNRVVSLTLKKLVWLTDDGQVHELNAPIDIDADLDP
jgi:hypothetical protein